MYNVYGILIIVSIINDMSYILHGDNCKCWTMKGYTCIPHTILIPQCLYIVHSHVTGIYTSQGQLWAVSTQMPLGTLCMD